MNAPLTVSMLMSSPVVSVTPDTRVDVAYRLMAERKISSVAVCDGPKPVGVVSLTDLLRLGRLEPMSLAGLAPLELPPDAVSQHMHLGVLTVRSDAPVREAAKRLVEHHVHRLYVDDGDGLVGVVSIEEMLVATRSLHLESPVSELMTKTVVTLPVTATLAEATAKLDHAHLTGLVIVDDHAHPVGAFTQVEALAAKDRPADERVEAAMSFSVVRTHPASPAYRVAAQAYEARARRVLVMTGERIDGVVTGLDFATLVARTS